jgi:predicted nucleic acid-binding protein
MKRIFIDCDVILDFLTGREPFSEPATHIFVMAEKKEITLFTSSLTYSHLFYLLRKSVSTVKLKEELKMLAEIVEPVTVDASTIKTALLLEFNDFEDAIQTCSARAEGITLLITRNVKDYRKSGLTVYTPLNFLKTLS